MDKPTIIWLPGLLCDAALFAPQIAHLADRYDSHVPDLRAGMDVDALADQILAAAPPRFILAGLSMGGYVAQAVLRRAPARVVRVILIATSARPDTHEQTERRCGLIALAERGRFRGVTPRLIPLLIHPDRLADEPLKQIIYDMAERIGPDAFARQQRAIWTRPDNRPALGAITCPALVIGGEADQLAVPEIIRELAFGIPDARLAMIAGSGHLPTLERPEAVNAVLDGWLGAGA